MLKTKWIWGLTVLWGVFVSGLGFQFFGAPGIKQWWALEKLQQERSAELLRLEQEIFELEKDAHRLETSAAYQEQEIRRVLGYVATDEMTFDFSLATQQIQERLLGSRTR